MMAIGAGGLDVAVAMAGGPFFLTYPRVIRVNLTGSLSPWVAAKDVILKLLEILTTKGNVGCIIEYGRITSYNVCYTKLLRAWASGPSY